MLSAAFRLTLTSNSTILCRRNMWLSSFLGTKQLLQQLPPTNPHSMMRMSTTTLLFATPPPSLLRTFWYTPTATATDAPVASAPVVVGWLPFGLDDTLSEWIQHGRMFIKRTFQPSLQRRKRKGGFLIRQKTVGGRRTLRRRKAKGRMRLGI